jgi:hypothetical protein
MKKKSLSESLAVLNKLASHYDGYIENKIKLNIPTKTAPPTFSNNRYELAYHKVFNDLPAWKQKEITDLKAAKDFDNRHLSEFVQQVIEMAESSIVF